MIYKMVAPRIVVTPTKMDGGVCANVALHDGKDSVTKRLWIRSTAINGSSISDLTAWMIALLPYAMRRGASLELAGTVDQEVLNQAPHIQKRFSQWYPARMRPVDIRTEGTTPAAPSSGSGAFFSGGLDSFFTLATAQPSPEFILFVHGFDIALDRTWLAEKVRQCARRAAAETGSQCIAISTNLKEFTDRTTRWGEEQHGAALAAVGYAHHDQIGTIRIAATYSDEYLHPWGSHPDLDPLWSSGAQRILHDSSWATRIEKASVAMTLRSARSGLRVCFQSADEYNCGRCEKCVRTRVNLLLAGRDGQCETLFPLDIESIRRIRLSNAGTRAFAQENLDYLRASGKSLPELEEVLERAIRTGQRRELFANTVKRIPGTLSAVRFARKMLSRR